MAEGSKIFSIVNGRETHEEFEQFGSNEVGTVGSSTVEGISGSSVPYDVVIEELERIASVYRQNATELARTVTAETGYPVRDAQALIEVVIDYLLHADEHYRATFRDEFSTPFDRAGPYVRRISTERRPKGTVLVITPANATVPLAALTVAAALLTGNTVVVRPSSRACESASRILAPFLERLPDAVHLVFADVADVVQPSVLSTVDVLHYTGSSDHYESIEKTVAEAKIDSYVEGEGSGLVVVEDDPRAAAEVCIDALTRCNGQLCTTPSGILVRSGLDDEFRTALEAELEGVVAGDPADRDTDIDANVSVAASGTELFPDVDVPVSIVEYDDSLADTELFGPVAWYRTYDDHDEVARLLENRSHGLNVTTFARDPSSLLEAVGAADRAVSSRVCINADPTLQSPFSPWGAMKLSGRSPGTTLLEKFSRSVVRVDGGRSEGDETFDALVLQSPGNVELDTFTKRSYDGLVVENEWSGVCGTDRAMYEGTLHSALPVVPGHENVATICEGSTRDIRGIEVAPGDPILWTGIRPCGSCEPCSNGRPNDCVKRAVNGVSTSSTLSPHVFGGWSERSYVDERSYVLRVGEWALNDPVAVLAEPLATILEMSARGDELLVVGTGTIGSLFAAKSATSEDVHVSVVTSHEKRETVEAWADESYVREREQPPQAAFDTVVNATGRAEVFERCLDLVKEGGVVYEPSVLGESRQQVDVSRITTKSLSIEGKLGYTSEDLVDAYEFVADHREDLRPLISTYELREYERALDADFKAVFDI